MARKALVPALLAIGLTLSILGDVGDARSTYDALVAWGKRVLATGELGLSNEQLYFVVAILLLALFVLLIQRILRDPEREGEKDRAAREREREILDEPDARRRYLRWLELDVENRLKESIHGAVLLDIGMEEDRDATRPWSFRATSSTEGQEFPNFEAALLSFNRRVLLLGSPGSGKTTTLLDAILQATRRALEDDEAPIPVYFNLSSFTDRPTHELPRWGRRERGDEIDGAEGLTYRDVEDLEHQMVAQMARLPSTNRAVCAKWFREGIVGLYLDGLDEVPEAYAKKLVQQINYGYCKRFTDRPLVVASRIIEYRTLQESREGGLKVDGAATLQPLAPEQIQQYLARCKDADGLRAALRDEETLAELASSPLTLSMMTLAYGGRSRGDIPSHLSLPHQRRELFDAFVPKMMQRQARRARGKIFSLDEREDVPTPYSVEEVNRYLGWFAVRLSERMRTLFSVRSLYEILRTEDQRGKWDLTVTTDAMVLGLFSLVGALLFGLAGLSAFPFWGILALLFGVGLAGLLIGNYFDILDTSNSPGWIKGTAWVAMILLGFACAAVCTLSFRSLAPDGLDNFLLPILAGLLIWAISGVVFAFTGYSPQKDQTDLIYMRYRNDNEFSRWTNRGQREAILGAIRNCTLFGICGGIVGLLGWWLLAAGSGWFKWIALGALLGLAFAVFLLVDQGAFFVAAWGILLLLTWGFSKALGLVTAMGDPAVPGAVVLGVMGLLIGLRSEGIELAAILLVFAWTGSLFLGSGGAVAGGLVFIPLAVRLLAGDERVKASLRERLSSPCVVLALAVSRILPCRLQRFFFYSQDSLLLKRTGTELEFSHRILRDHFATRDLVQGLVTSDGEERLGIIRRLGTQGEAALDVLASFLKGHDIRLREAAVRSICRI